MQVGLNEAARMAWALIFPGLNEAARMAWALIFPGLDEAARMAWALIFPEPAKPEKIKPSATRASMARTVLRFTPEAVPQTMSGALHAAQVADLRERLATAKAECHAARAVAIAEWLRLPWWRRMLGN